MADIDATDNGGLRIGALATNTAAAVDAAGAGGLARARARDPGRRDPAIAQQGDHRRQSVPADALLLLHQYRPALQQARSRLRLRRDRRHRAAARGAGHQRPMHRDLSRRHGGGAGRAGRDRSRSRARTTARVRAGARFPPAARRHALARQCARRGRDHHRRDLARAGRRQADLPQGARAIVLCLCAGVGRGGRRHGRRRADHPRRSRLWRSGAQAVARSAHRRTADRQDARRKPCSTRPPTCCWKMRRAMARTISRYRLRGGRWRPCWAKRRGHSHDSAFQAGRAGHAQPARPRRPGRDRQAPAAARRSGRKSPAPRTYAAEYEVGWLLSKACWSPRRSRAAQSPRIDRGSGADDARRRRGDRRRAHDRAPRAGQGGRGAEQQPAQESVIWASRLRWSSPKPSNRRATRPSICHSTTQRKITPMSRSIRRRSKTEAGEGTRQGDLAHAMAEAAHSVDVSYHHRRPCLRRDGAACGLGAVGWTTS